MSKIQNNKVVQDPLEKANVTAVIIIAAMFIIGFAFLYYVFLG